uniref:Peptidase S1 domain-containing protein n=1 Tax=Clastoptera arizonana TaxID=38151 RepID=A0A1B6DI71_9HEMI
MLIRCLFTATYVVAVYTWPLGLEEGETCDIKSGILWKCRKLSQCSTAITKIRNGTVPQPTICKFEGFEPIVCCEEINSIPLQTITTKKPSITNRLRSVEMCKKYAKYVYQEMESVLLTSDDKEKVDTCAAVEALITNGKNTEPREYPHMALLGYGSSPKSARWLCGGSLISERYVITAAHCTMPGTRWGSVRWVRLGEYNTGTTNDDLNGDAKTTDYEVEQIINHPQSRPPMLYHDVALLKLNKIVAFNAFIRPLCLHDGGNLLNKNAIATGWGHTELGGKSSKILQKVSLNILNNEACQSTFSTTGNAPKQIPKGIIKDYMLCAGDLITAKDTCQGDSGGPLQVRLQEPYCMYSLIGITSFGKLCGGNTPAIYTRISYYTPWIENIVWN